MKAVFCLVGLLAGAGAGVSASAASPPAAREVRLRLTAASEEPLGAGGAGGAAAALARAGSGPESLAEQAPRAHELSVTGTRRVAGHVPTERRPQLSSDRLVVEARDRGGKTIARVLIPDPRLLRAEVPDASGALSSRIFYRRSVEFTVAVPDDPAIELLKIYQPRWDGSRFELEPIGEARLP